MLTLISTMYQQEAQRLLRQIQMKLFTWITKQLTQMTLQQLSLFVGVMVVLTPLPTQASQVEHKEIESHIHTHLGLVPGRTPYSYQSIHIRQQIRLHCQTQHRKQLKSSIHRLQHQKDCRANHSALLLHPLALHRSSHRDISIILQRVHSEREILLQDIQHQVQSKQVEKQTHK